MIIIYLGKKIFEYSLFIYFIKNQYFMKFRIGFSSMLALMLLFSACNSDYLDGDGIMIKSGESGLPVFQSNCHTTYKEAIKEQKDFNAWGTQFKGSGTVVIAEGITLTKKGNETWLEFEPGCAEGTFSIAYKSGNYFDVYEWVTTNECVQGLKVFFDGKTYSVLRYDFVPAPEGDDGDNDNGDDQGDDNNDQGDDNNNQGDDNNNQGDNGQGGNGQGGNGQGGNGQGGNGQGGNGQGGNLEDGNNNKPDPGGGNSQ